MPSSDYKVRWLPDVNKRSMPLESFNLHSMCPELTLVSVDTNLIDTRPALEAVSWIIWATLSDCIIGGTLAGSQTIVGGVEAAW